jgi:hypothetical protein
MASIVTQTLQVLASSVQIVDVTIDENSFVYDMALLCVFSVTKEVQSIHTVFTGCRAPDEEFHGLPMM